MTKTNVYLRELGQFKRVTISSDMKPEVQKEIVDKWQNIMNVYARVLGVSAGLIMRITKDHMNVFLKSDGKDNPYPDDGKDELGSGLYCETAIGENRMLHVKNALEDNRWKDNPDVALGMISYLGMPIRWKDGAFFGTICFLDDRTKMYSEENVLMLELFRDAIETDLKNLELIDELTMMAHTDVLTKVANRRKIMEYLENDMTPKNKRPLSCIMIDIDCFKPINDTFGHDVGDEILIAFSQAIESTLSNKDRLGRLGGDEFLLVLPERDRQYSERLVQRMEKNVSENRILKKYGVSFSYGIAEVNEGRKTVQGFIRRADVALIEAKKNRARH